MLKTERYATRWTRATVAISACLILLSISCTERPKPAPAPQIIYVYPPAVYTQLCEKTPFTGSTFGDAVIALQVAQNELDVCASRIEGLIKWQKDKDSKGDGL
ncbi:Rz1-like lysis system protein LysC [Serratia fonticola]|uniref:Rz1-like lysis system protein LysC n=1 Tax=Serratia fonticola TaxID=47917 RepID=UPI0021165F8D|nr:Rz1-like lysis system protein LysC [Serratia fonticola]